MVAVGCQGGVALWSIGGAARAPVAGSVSGSGGGGGATWMTFLRMPRVGVDGARCEGCGMSKGSSEITQREAADVAATAVVAGFLHACACACACVCVYVCLSIPVTSSRYHLGSHVTAAPPT